MSAEELRPHVETPPRPYEPTQAKLKKLAVFCRRMGREAKQGEIVLVIADEYFAIRNYKEPKR